MNFFTWEQEHGQYYRDMVNADEVHNMPAFAESSKCPTSDMIMSVIEKRVADGRSIMEIIPVICEYLYETYHVSPMDIEIISQYVMIGALKMAMDLGMRAGEEIGRMKLKGDGNINEDS